MVNNKVSFSTRVIRSFLYSGVGNTITKLINVVGLFFVLKLISPDEFGIASIVIAIFAIIQAFTEMGLGASIVQAEKLSKRELSSLFWISIGITTIIYSFIFFTAPLAANFYEQSSLKSLIRINGIVVVIFTFYFISYNMLKREMKFKEIAIIDNVSLLVSSIIMVALAYFNFGAWSIIIAEISYRFGQLMYTQYFYPFWPKLEFNWNEIQPKVEFGLYATGSRLLYNLYSNADYLIVGKIFGSTSVGIYSFAYNCYRHCKVVDK